MLCECILNCGFSLALCNSKTTTTKQEKQEPLPLVQQTRCRRRPRLPSSVTIHLANLTTRRNSDDNATATFVYNQVVIPHPRCHCYLSSPPQFQEATCPFPKAHSVSHVFCCHRRRVQNVNSLGILFCFPMDSSFAVVYCDYFHSRPF